MAKIIVVGDGPGGLSAALFLAKAGQEAVVFGAGQTGMNYAYLYNYLGIPEISGPAFQQLARTQAESFGARIEAEEATDAAEDGGGFTVAAGGGAVSADYLVLAEGKALRLAAALGLERGESGAVAVDRDGRTSMDRVYAVGRAVRPVRVQAVISAGEGAAAALDILSAEAGRDVRDWDTPPEDAG